MDFFPERFHEVTGLVKLVGREKLLLLIGWCYCITICGWTPWHLPISFIAYILNMYLWVAIVKKCYVQHKTGFIAVASLRMPYNRAIRLHCKIGLKSVLTGMGSLWRRIGSAKRFFFIILSITFCCCNIVSNSIRHGLLWTIANEKLCGLNVHENKISV